MQQETPGICLPGVFLCRNLCYDGRWLVGRSGRSLAGLSFSDRLTAFVNSAMDRCRHSSSDPNLRMMHESHSERQTRVP